MGSKISVLNDTEYEVKVRFDLEGGGQPASGHQSKVLKPGEAHIGKFSLSLAVIIVVEYTPPNSHMVTKSLHKFSPPGDKETLKIAVSSMIGHPKLKLENPTTKWQELLTITNASDDIEPETTYTANYGFTDTQGNSTATTMATTIAAGGTFKKVFDVSIEQAFGSENKDWFEQSITESKTFEIAIPSVPGHKKLVLSQHQAWFDITGDITDSFRVASKRYKIEVKELDESGALGNALHACLIAHA